MELLNNPDTAPTVRDVPVLSTQNVLPAAWDIAAIGAAMARAEQASPEPRTVNVDIGEFVGAPAGVAVFTLGEMDAPRLFTVPSDGQVVRRRQPMWPEELCQTVAMLALAHRGPEMPKGQKLMDFYIRIADKHPKLLLHLVASYKKAFPTSLALDHEGDDLKNG